jgi:DNA-binding Lrp family transcriptional regulator
MRSQTATAGLPPEAQRALRLLSEQVAIPLDQLSRLLDVSMQDTVRTVQELEAAGCLRHRRFLVAEGPWFWLNHRGLGLAGTGFGYRAPDVARLAHRRALNEIRIYLSERAPEGRWLCERMVYRRRDPNDHLPDALFEVDGERHAIEAELSPKSDREIRQILAELSQRYDAALYFCGPLTYRMMKRLSAEGRWPKLIVRRLPEAE